MMASKAVFVFLTSLLITPTLADYRYPNWSSLPLCAQNCLSSLVAVSKAYDCSGTNITCACYDTPSNFPNFDSRFASCVSPSWNAKSKSGGCSGFPDTTDETNGELLKYEHDIFCYLNNGTATGSATSSTSSASGKAISQSSASASAPVTTTTSHTATATTTARITANSSSNTLSMTYPTLPASVTSPTSASIDVTTVHTVVTANTTINLHSSTSTSDSVVITVTATPTHQPGSKNAGFRNMDIIKEHFNSGNAGFVLTLLLACVTIYLGGENLIYTLVLAGVVLVVFV